MTDLTLVLNKILARLDELEERIERLRRDLDNHEEAYLHTPPDDYYY